MKTRISCSILVLFALGFHFSTPLTAAPAKEVIRTVQSRMVKIFGSGGVKKLAGYGTGFLVTPQGHIVTIWSHVLDGESVTVILDDGRRYQAKVLGAEPTLDVAVLKIDATLNDLPHFTQDDFATGGPGTRIWGFSNMFKVATGDEPVSVLHGVIGAKTKLTARRGTFEVPYQGTVYIVDAITNNSGAGGGVITSRTGKLLGMIGKELRNTQNHTWINYAIPIVELKDVIQAIIEGKYLPEEKKEEEENPNRYSTVDFGLVMVPDVLFRTPAFIDRTLRGSPAAQSGLKSNDLVVFVNEELIQSCKMLEKELGKLKAGDPLRIVVRRGSKLITAEMVVEKKEQ